VIPQPAITRYLDKLLADIPFQGKRVCQSSDSLVLRPLLRPRSISDKVLALTPDISANCSSVSRAAPMTAQQLTETQMTSDRKTIPIHN
jgi:hypothetical protein